MTQELSVEEAHQHRSEIQYAKYKSRGKYSNLPLIHILRRRRTTLYNSQCYPIH